MGVEGEERDEGKKRRAMKYLRRKGSKARKGMEGGGGWYLDGSEGRREGGKG